MLSNFASDLHFGSRIGQDVKVLCGERQIFSGKWRAGFHERIISHAFQEGEPVTVLRARDNQLLFRIQPKAYWDDIPEDDHIWEGFENDR